MKPGISTYAYFWRELTLEEMLADAARLGAEVLQICDCPEVETIDRRALAATAQALGVELELGTRGLQRGHLERYLEYAHELGAMLLRTMVIPGAPNDLADIDTDITIALENYEQLPTRELRAIAEEHGVGICLDPGNSVAALELPETVIERLAPYVVNLHVKDFGFARREGWVGFTFAGRPLGDGLLDLDFMLDTLRAHGRDPNAIVELWVPQEQREDEADWAERSLARLADTIRRRSKAGVA